MKQPVCVFNLRRTFVIRLLSFISLNLNISTFAYFSCFIFIVITNPILMKIDLPLETWTELFGFLPRTQLVALLPQIDDRKFASFLQFFLLKCGNITLGYLSITKLYGNGETFVRKLGHYDRELPLADTPMPENIKNFAAIHLNYFNESVLEFLKELHRNSLLNNVHFDIALCDRQLFRAVFPKVLPLLSNIHSITTRDYVMSILQEEFSELAIPMLASVRFLTDSFNAWKTNFRNDWYSDWLCTPPADGQPRVLTLHPDPVGSEDGETYIFMLSFVQHIKQNFMEAGQPVSFCIHISWFLNMRLIENQILENSHTNEQLIIEEIYDQDERYSLRICRYPKDADEEWIELMGKKPPAKLEYRTVELFVYEK